MATPSVFDHYRPAGTDYPAGSYRVVGTTDTTVTLLRVGDSDGQRIHTGEIYTVSRDAFAAFEPAVNPDTNKSPTATLQAVLNDSYWSLRAFIQQLRAHPLPATVALGVAMAGLLGDGRLPVPDIALVGLLLVGGLGLAYIGSGRLR